MRRKERDPHSTLGLAVMLLFCLTPRDAMANAGVPMLGVFLPVLILLLLPIIGIETSYVMRRLRVDWRRAVRAVTLANLFSSFLGIPLTWLLLAVLEFQVVGFSAYGISTFSGRIVAVTWQAPWLVPYRYQLDWMIPAAGLVLLVPFFFVTWWSEYRVLQWFLPEADRPLLWRVVRNGNLLSYALLAIALLLFPILNHVD